LQSHVLTETTKCQVTEDKTFWDILSNRYCVSSEVAEESLASVFKEIDGKWLGRPCWCKQKRSL